jgi:hypothetical protein
MIYCIDFCRYQNQGFATAFEKVSGFAGVSETNDFGGAALAFLASAGSLPKPNNGWYPSTTPSNRNLLH